MSNLIIEHLKPSDLCPYARNAKRHDPAQISKLCGSIREFGFNNPVLIDSDNGIIAGHGRVLAAQSLGLEKIPCIRLGHLTDTQRRAYILADNRLAEIGGGWDEEMLKLELADLAALDVDVAEIGFGAEDLADLEIEDEAETSDADAEPQIDKAEELRAKWGVEPGQLWELGDHRLLCGDSTKKEDAERVMGEERAGAVVTDPPYGQNQPGVPNDAPELLNGIVAGAIAAIPCDNAVAVFFQSPRTFPVLLDAARGSGWKFERMLWLYKTAQCVSPWRGWLLKSEAILVFSKGNAEWVDAHPYSHDCYQLSEVSGELPKDSGWHGSVKPMKVVRDIVSRVGGTIYEPFSGSGTTIIACEQLGRKCRAIEISPAYVAVAIQRWADATGKEPKRLA